MADFSLHISKSDYEEKITILQAYLGRLQDTKTAYQNLKNRSSDFMDESDDKCEAVKENIQQNIEAVQAAIDETSGAIKVLQATLDTMDDGSNKIGNIVNNATDAAKSAINIAKNAAKLFG